MKLTEKTLDQLKVAGLAVGLSMGAVGTIVAQYTMEETIRKILDNKYQIDDVMDLTLTVNNLEEEA